jgi:hypothetical protein
MGVPRSGHGAKIPQETALDGEYVQKGKGKALWVSRNQTPYRFSFITGRCAIGRYSEDFRPRKGYNHRQVFKVITGGNQAVTRVNSEKRDDKRDDKRTTGPAINRQPLNFTGVPKGIRTPVAGVKGRFKKSTA